MYCSYSLCDDGIFRGIFGQLGSERILKGLLNAVLTEAKDPIIQSLEIMNPFEFKDLLDQKQSVLDVKAKDQTGRSFDIEVQTASHLYFRERILYYWARLYSQYLNEGEDYSKLRPVTSVIFTKYPLFTDEKDNLFSTFRLRSEQTNHLYSDHLQLHFLRVPEKESDFLRFSENQSLQNWLKTLNYPNLTSEEEMETLSATNPEINEVFQKAQLFFADPRTRDYLEGREKFRLEQATRLHTAREEGLEEGLEKGQIKAHIWSILITLQSRFGEDTPILEQQLSNKSEEELAKLFKASLSVSSLEEFQGLL